MANLTDAMENQLLDALTGVTTVLSATMSIALFTADPTETGSVTNEYTLNGSQRLLLSGLFSAATGGTSANTAIITVATATADWAAISHVGLMASDVEGTDDMKVWIELNSPISILSGQAFSFAIGDLTVTAA